MIGRGRERQNGCRRLTDTAHTHTFSLSISISLSPSPSLHLSISPFSPSLHLSISPSLHLSLSFCLSVSPSFSLSPQAIEQQMSPSNPTTLLTAYTITDIQHFYLLIPDNSDPSNTTTIAPHITHTQLVLSNFHTHTSMHLHIHSHPT